MPLGRTHARQCALQFRYLFVTTAQGLQTLLDVTHPAQAACMLSSTGTTCRMADARKVYVARTYAYVAGRQGRGLVIVDVEKPRQRRRLTRVQRRTASSSLTRSQMSSWAPPMRRCLPTWPTAPMASRCCSSPPPDTQPKFYGFSPEPKPEPDRLAPDPVAGAVAVQRSGPRPRRR